jgi:N-methylhydantoinase A/oxoprolinase/acetone carboxylase beta subunit
VLQIASEDDVKAICDAFTSIHRTRYGELAAIPVAGINVENFYLFAAVALPKPVLPELPLEGKDSAHAVKDCRPVFWRDDEDFRETTVLDADLLRPGNVVAGPAIIEARDTTIVLPPQTRYTVDRHLSGVIENV